jgi:hypothetical protein
MRGVFLLPRTCEAVKLRPAHSVFPQPVRPKHPDLLNFRLTQFLFFYSLYSLPLA